MSADIDYKTNPDPWPVLRLTIEEDGRGLLNGQEITAADPTQTEASLTAAAAAVAGEHGGPLLAHRVDSRAGDSSRSSMVVFPDGTVRLQDGTIRTYLDAFGSPLPGTDGARPHLTAVSAAPSQADNGISPTAPTGRSTEQTGWTASRTSRTSGRNDPKASTNASPSTKGSQSAASSRTTPKPAQAVAVKVTTETGTPLTPAEALYKPRPVAPTRGWQRVVFRASGGTVNPGLGRKERIDTELIRRIRTPLGGERHRFATMCFKGGIGKTSVTAGIGLIMAHYRADPVMVADFNPDAGDLSLRLTGRALGAVTSLVESIDQVRSLSDLSKYVVTADRLTVLPGEPNPKAGLGMSSEDFDRAMDVLETYYGLIGVDTGEGVTRPIMPGILRRVDSLVIAAGHSVTGAQSAIATLDWLDRNGFADIAQSAVVALTAKDGVSREMNTAAAVEQVRARCRVLVVVPADPHVADGAALRLDKMQPKTRRAFMELAAAVADGFNGGRVVDAEPLHAQLATR